MNSFVIFALFATSQALQSRENCIDIMTGKLCLKFQKKNFSSCKRSSSVVVSQNEAFITGSEYCAKIVDICTNVFHSPPTTVKPTTKKELPPPVKRPVVLTTTTTVMPVKQLPPPVKKPVVLTTTTIVTPIAKKELSMPEKEPETTTAIPNFQI
jgi:hypothetical protein